MKHLRYLILMVLCTAMLGLLSCGDDGPKKTPEEKQLELLARDWTVSSVVADGVDITSNFSGLVVTFDLDGNYSTNTGYGPVWPDSGTFTLSGSDFGTIERSDGVSLSITEVTATSLTVGFTYSTLPGGRVSGILGDYVCQFTSP